MCSVNSVDLRLTKSWPADCCHRLAGNGFIILASCYWLYGIGFLVFASCYCLDRIDLMASAWFALANPKRFIKSNLIRENCATYSSQFVFVLAKLVTKFAIQIGFHQRIHTRIRRQSTDDPRSLEGCCNLLAPTIACEVHSVNKSSVITHCGQL